MSRSQARSIHIPTNCLLACLCLAAVTAFAGLTPQEVAKLVPADGAQNSYAGYSVAVEGDTVVIGAWGDNDAGTQTGAAYIFCRNHGGPDAWGEVKKLTASDMAAGNYFGFSVAISGDTVVAGSSRDDSAGTEAGSAYVFQRNHGGADNWGEVKKIYPSDPEAYSSFGFEVAVSGDTVVIGAVTDEIPQDSGSAYVFSRNHGGADNWGEVAKITASDAAAFDTFGQGVAISGDLIAVGAPNDDVGANTDQGSVYVFARNHGGADAWGEVAKLTTTDGAEYDNLGFYVDIDGDTVAVGASRDDDNGPDSGSVYIFSRNHGGLDSWGQVTKLTPSEGAAGDAFGLDVAIFGDRVVAGAPNDDDAGTTSGSAYVFDRNQGGPDAWGEVLKLTASDAAGGDDFGYSVAVSPDMVVVGAYGDDDMHYQSGSAYVFANCGGDPGEWEEAVKATASDPEPGDYFGWASAASGDTFVVGAHRNSDAGPNSGSAYVFERNSGGADAWGQVVKLTASDASSYSDFGWSVGIWGDTIIVGAQGADGLGAAYIFERNQGGADVWGEVAKLVPSDGLPGDSMSFGVSVAIFGSTVVVGAEADDFAGLSTGSAYVFERNQGGADNWGEVAKITASDYAAGDSFGLAVSISQDTAAVGAPYHMDDMGATYVFARNQGGADSWGQVAKVMAWNAGLGDCFGDSVSISNDTMVVGAKYEDAAADNAGTAYIFARNQGGADAWGGVTKLVASDAQATDFLGWSVSIAGETIVLGARGATHVAWDAGAAYIYERNQGGADSWGEVAKITASDAAENDYFGVSVAITGNTVVVGSEHDDDGGTDSGSAYVFRRSCSVTYDLGDAPDPSYPTLLASDGARHVLGGGLFLGAGVDADGDGQPNGTASGDDSDGNDDEDGVVFTSMLIPGEPATVEVVSSGTGLLNTWIDFNADGDWADAGEQVFTDGALGVGVNPLAFDVPATAQQGATTFARFRVDSVGGLSFTGEAADGEVEDHAVTIAALDFGDAPDPTYPTLLASDGARHVLGSGLYLGAAVDADADGQPTGDATGDDSDGTDDEDGVALPASLLAGATESLDLTVSAAGFVDAWIDFNADGDWLDPGETILDGVVVAPGLTSVPVQVPLDAAPGTTFARFRVSTLGLLAPFGLADDGEVEDYAVQIAPSVELAVTIADSPDPAVEGGSLRYFVNVTNSGAADATGVTLSDTLPIGVVFVGSSPSAPTCTESGGVVTCDLSSLSAGAETQVVIDLDIPFGVTGTLNNSAAVTANEIDPVPGNDSDVEQTTVVSDATHIFSDGFETGSTSRWSASSG